MSEEPHGATTIRASKGGGGSGGAKWLLGAAAAIVLIGGGYLVWQNFAPEQDSTQTAYDDLQYSAELEPGQEIVAETALADDSAAASATTESTPRSTARAAPVPEETIGITPASATTTEGATESDEIVVTAPRRPIWASTPSPRRLSAMYPERALERGREGEARLHCIVQAGGALACERVSETPGGFGNAALRVARTLRHAPTLADGSDATGSPVRLRVVFRMAEEQGRRG